jgi:uncharacterized membrane protein required for colicin V production
MDISSARDWIIIIVGALEIILIIGAMIFFLIMYQKMKKFLERTKDTIQKIEDIVNMAEKTLVLPCLRAGSWLLKFTAAIQGIFNKRKQKEEQANG